MGGLRLLKQELRNLIITVMRTSRFGPPNIQLDKTPVLICSRIEESGDLRVSRDFSERGNNEGNYHIMDILSEDVASVNAGERGKQRTDFSLPAANENSASSRFGI